MITSRIPPLVCGQSCWSQWFYCRCVRFFDAWLCHLIVSFDQLSVMTLSNRSLLYLINKVRLTLTWCQHDCSKHVPAIWHAFSASCSTRRCMQMYFQSAYVTPRLKKAALAEDDAEELLTNLELICSMKATGKVSCQPVTIMISFQNLQRSTESAISKVVSDIA